MTTTIADQQLPTLPGTPEAVYRSEACTRCGCQAVADLVRYEPDAIARLLGGKGQTSHHWRAPDASCDCVCHDSYRMVHGLPRPGVTS